MKITEEQQREYYSARDNMTTCYLLTPKEFYLVGLSTGEKDSLIDTISKDLVKKLQIQRESFGCKETKTRVSFGQNLFSINNIMFLIKSFPYVFGTYTGKIVDLEFLFILTDKNHENNAKPEDYEAVVEHYNNLAANNNNITMKDICYYPLIIEVMKKVCNLGSYGLNKYEYLKYVTKGKPKEKLESIKSKAEDCLFLGCSTRLVENNNHILTYVCLDKDGKRAELRVSAYAENKISSKGKPPMYWEHKTHLKIQNFWNLTTGKEFGL